MMQAYSDLYLEDAMRNLGEAFDCAYHNYDIDLDVFLNMFIESGIAQQIELGFPKYLIGLSGCELVKVVIENTNYTAVYKDKDRPPYSIEYWCGWFLAYFQWHHAISFQNINYYISMHELKEKYPILHEVSEQKATHLLDEYIRNKHLPTKLQYLRQGIGISQSELSRQSGISLRMIQQYEQRKKDINKASISTIYALSRVLKCDMEYLLEYDF